MRRQQLILAAAIAGVAVIGLSLPQARAHPDYSCESCHVPHGAHQEDGVPLWNPDHTTVTQDLGSYSSPTMDATVSTTPTGASKLCLSCHDGTYTHVSEGHTFGPLGTLGTLEQSHPISFVYDDALADADGELIRPSDMDEQTRKNILPFGRMECTSCHEIHDAPGSDRQDHSNLRWPWPYEGSGTDPGLDNSYGLTTRFCENCHNKSERF
jgi:hypothetical protein